MTKLKDRLSASVRMAKAAQHATADPSAAEQRSTPSPTESDSAGSRPAAEKAPATRPAVPRAPAAKATPTARGSREPRKPPAGSASGSGDIPESGSTLFPDRIWPD